MHRSIQADREGMQVRALLQTSLRMGSRELVGAILHGDVASKEWSQGLMLLSVSLG